LALVLSFRSPAWLSGRERIWQTVSQRHSFLLARAVPMPLSAWTEVCSHLVSFLSSKLSSQLSSYHSNLRRRRGVSYLNDLGKIAVVAGILGALLIFGLLLAPVETETSAPVVVQEEVVVQEVTVLQDRTLEMLDPIYSEKAVFQDDTIRIAFDVMQTEAGIESRLPFWVHNVSDDVINILWERCSLQLPCGTTVKIVNEEAYAYDTPVSEIISIAPAGDLFDAFIPVSELSWNDEWEPVLTSGVFDEGTFTLVLAIERAVPIERVCTPPMADRKEEGCDGEHGMQKPELAKCEGKGAREIAYYTFRFVIR